MTHLTLPSSARPAKGPSHRRRVSVAWGLGALFCMGVALFSYRHLAGIGPGGPLILGNGLSRPWLYLHICGAATALLVAPLQMLPGLRRRSPSAHRLVGRLYVIGCLMGGCGGFVSAFGSTAGPVATAGFATLAVAWVACTALGWLKAVQGDVTAHRRWMTYSFAMTFAAVTLRAYLPVFPLLRLPFIDGYRLAAWSSWIGNLLVAEVWLQWKARRPLRRPPSA